MTFVIASIAVVLLIIAAVAVRPRRNEDGERDRSPILSLALLAGAALIILIVLFPAIAGIDINWTINAGVVGIIGLALMIAGFGTGRSFFAAVGIFLLAVFAAMALGVTWWVLVPAGLAAVFITADHLTRRTIFGVLAAVAIAVSLSFISLPSFNVATSPEAAVEQAEMSLTRDFQKQLKAAKVDPVKFKEECEKANITTVCAVIQGNTTDIRQLQKEQDRLWEVLLDKGITAIPADVDTDKAAKALAKTLARMGWKKGEVVTGDKIDWSENTYDAGEYPFSAESVKSQTQLKKFLAQKKGEGKAAADVIKREVKNKDHEKLFLSGKNMIPVQFTESSCVKGNTYYAGGKVVKGDKVCHEKGDIWWVPVAPDGTVYWSAAVRADCGNPGAEHAPYPTRNKTGKPHTPSGGGDTPNNPPNHYVPPNNPPGNPPSGGCKDEPCSPNQGKTGWNKRATEGRTENHQVNQGESTRRQDDPQGDAQKAEEKAEQEQEQRQETADEAADEADTDSGGGDDAHESTDTSGDGGAGEQTDGGQWN